MGCRWSVSAIPGATQSGQGPGVTGRCMLWLQSLSSTRYARSSKLLFPCFLLILFWLQPLSSTRHAQSPKLLFPCFLLILFWLQSLSSTRYARSPKLLSPCFLLILLVTGRYSGYSPSCPHDMHDQDQLNCCLHVFSSFYFGCSPSRPQSKLLSPCVLVILLWLQSLSSII